MITYTVTCMLVVKQRANNAKEAAQVVKENFHEGRLVIHPVTNGRHSEIKRIKHVQTDVYPTDQSQS
jgi:hypothetical protein